MTINTTNTNTANVKIEERVEELPKITQAVEEVQTLWPAHSHSQAHAHSHSHAHAHAQDNTRELLSSPKSK